MKGRLRHGHGVAGLAMRVALLASALGCLPFAARADELSGADKLRVIWTQQMNWTPAGLPIVTVGIVEGKDEVVIEGQGAPPRLLPDGDGGAELRAGRVFHVRAIGAKPARIRYHVVVASVRPSEAEQLGELQATWRARGFEPKTFELGIVFGLRGEVIDMRKLVLAVSPSDSVEAARAAQQSIHGRFSVDTSLYPQVIERPRGVIEARDERGTVVQNEGVLWFGPSEESGALVVPEVPRDGNAVPERRSYGGRLYVTLGSDGKLSVVNAVPEDRLLAGLLPSEMGAQAPPEALKAQAVAARNELLAKLGTRHLTDPFRVCARTHCQVYAGAAHEDPRATAAVKATRGELLVRPDGRLVDAVYSSCCGGHTEDNDLAWRTTPDPALRGSLDADAAVIAKLGAYETVHDAAAFLGPLPARPACAASPQYRWETVVEAAAVATRAGVGRIRDVAVLERGVSGRVVHLRVDGERGQKDVRGELEVRRLFGMLKSALFVFEVERDTAGSVVAFHFRGGGHGHGIGMCQAGAMGMAAEGRRYDEILHRYYRDAAIRRFY